MGDSSSSSSDEEDLAALRSVVVEADLLLKPAVNSPQVSTRTLFCLIILTLNTRSMDSLRNWAIQGEKGKRKAAIVRTGNDEGGEDVLPQGFQEQVMLP